MSEISQSMERYKKVVFKVGYSVTNDEDRLFKMEQMETIALYMENLMEVDHRTEGKETDYST